MILMPQMKLEAWNPNFKYGLEVQQWIILYP